MAASICYCSPVTRLQYDRYLNICVYNIYIYTCIYIYIYIEREIDRHVTVKYSCCQNLHHHQGVLHNHLTARSLERMVNVRITIPRWPHILDWRMIVVVQSRNGLVMGQHQSISSVIYSYIASYRYLSEVSIRSYPDFE